MTQDSCKVRTNTKIVTFTQQILVYIIFGVPLAVKFHIAVLWVITQCTVVIIISIFRVPYKRKEQASFTKQHSEDLSLLRYNVMSIAIWEPMFQRSLLSLSSGDYLKDGASQLLQEKKISLKQEKLLQKSVSMYHSIRCHIQRLDTSSALL